MRIPIVEEVLMPLNKSLVFYISWVISKIVTDSETRILRQACWSKCLMLLDVTMQVNA
jgi:hypothetical protein